MDRIAHTLSQMDEASRVIDSYLKAGTYRTQNSRGDIVELDLKPLEALQIITGLEKIYKMHIDLEKRIKGEGRYINAEQFLSWLEGMKELLQLFVPARKREEASLWLHGLVERIFQAPDETAIPGEVRQDSGQEQAGNSVQALPPPSEVPGGSPGE